MHQYARACVCLCLCSGVLFPICLHEFEYIINIIYYYCVHVMYRMCISFDDCIIRQIVTSDSIPILYNPRDKNSNQL